jgi:type IV pilus assembly protein PilQ
MPVSKNIAHRLFTLLLIGFLSIAVSSCDKKKELSFDQEKLIDTSIAFDKAKFIEQTKEKSAEEYKYGPKINELDRITEEDRFRRVMNKEESFDFADLNESDENNFKISANVENMDIRSFCDMLSMLTNVNILVSDEVKGNVSAKLKDVYWTSMLDSVLNTKALAKYVDNKSNIIRIHDQTTVTQLEEFEQKRKENVQKSLMLKKASQPLYTEIFKLFYTKPDKIKTQIAEILSSKDEASKGVRNINPEVTVDERKNLVIVKARKEDMDVIAKLITELDTRTQQIFIEAFIVEVDDDFEKAFGTRFGVISEREDLDVNGLGGTVETTTTLGDSSNTISNLPVESSFGGIGVLAGLGNSTDLKVELTAMETQGLSKVISNPRIFTLDNQEAVIFQGDEVPYETVSQDGTEVQFKEAGLKLAVTPQIIGDGNLQISIQVNKDTVDTTISNPPITKSEIKTNLVTKDGEIVVMGGIYTETGNDAKDKVPGLGDIPGVGYLFRRQSKEDTRKELIIFIAPKIL